MISKRVERKRFQRTISLSLDDYNDIFSDFDPRSASVRALSVDFLEEAKRASMDKDEGLELNLLIPKEKRSFRKERIIEHRLRNHFEKHHRILKKEDLGLTKKGILFVVTGILFMIAAAYVLINYSNKTTLTHFFVIFLEPAGWFFFWEGLSMIIFKPRDKKTELAFYKKLANAKINFASY
jgi:hypothetical protein